MLMLCLVIKLMKSLKIVYFIPKHTIVNYQGPVVKILDKVVHWTTPDPVDSWPVDQIGCSKVKTMVG